jgi:hypothetical protein
MVDTLHGTARGDCNISDLWLIWFGLVYGVSGENHLPAASLWQIYHIIEYTSPWTGFELTTFVVVGTDCISSCESNYHTITTLSDWYKANLSFIIWNAELFYCQNKLKYIRIYLRHILKQRYNNDLYVYSRLMWQGNTSLSETIFLWSSFDWLIKTKISNSVRTTRFRNSFHQVHQGWKVK